MKQKSKYFQKQVFMQSTLLFVLVANYFLSGCHSERRQRVSINGSPFFTPFPPNVSQIIPPGTTCHPSDTPIYVAVARVATPSKPDVCQILFYNVTTTPQSIDAPSYSSIEKTAVSCVTSNVNNGPWGLTWNWPTGVGGSETIPVTSAVGGNPTIYTSLESCVPGDAFACTFWNNTIFPEVACTGIVLIASPA